MRQAAKGNTVLTFGVVASLGWLVLVLSPFLVAGESWGMVWYMIHFPLVGVYEAGVGPAPTYVMVAVVSTLQAFVFGLAVAVIVWGVRCIGRWIERVGDAGR